MTCFWDGNIAAIGINLLKEVLGCDCKPNPQKFVKLLKVRAIKTRNMMWNGETLGEQILTDNLTSIKNLNVNVIHKGYDCSSCDPYLLLIGELFKINIQHNFNGTVINYKNIHATKIMIVGSSTSHFYCVKKCHQES